MALPLLISRFELIASQFSVIVSEPAGVNDEPITVPAGFYYNDSSTSAESLASTLKTALDGHSTLGAFTVTWSTTTGKFTISNAAGFELDFTGQTDFRDWLGFTSTTKTGASTYTSDNRAQGCIFAAGGQEHPTGLEPHYTGGTARAKSGKQSHVGSSSRNLTASWEHGFEPLSGDSTPLSGTWDDTSHLGTGTVVPWTWDDFHTHHQTGEPFRYMDAGAAIAVYQDEYQLDGAAYREFKPKPIEPANFARWMVRLVVCKFVP